MGKKQHQKDKLYLTTLEWKELFGGHKGGALEAARVNFRRLPFDHCSLSLQPFENPMGTLDGHVFDILNIVPYLKKFGQNPVTGEKLDAKGLIHLHFHKNAEGQYQCPVMFRSFTENSHIVAIKPTGNVYSYEAVEQLNLKQKYWKDLLTDEPFTKSDIITIQDPMNLDKFNISKFYHIKHAIKVVDEEELKARANPEYTIKSMNTETRHTLEQLRKDYQPPSSALGMSGEGTSKAGNSKLDAVNAAHYSTGRVAHGLTSTVMEPLTVHEAAVVDEELLRYARVTKKGYVRLVTNLGPLNFELHCDVVPRTCENFIRLCKRGYYNDTRFHRLIKYFMVQGGDPTDTGKGGESSWGEPFKDEFKQHLSHSDRGILSMANSGPNTNKSQFFITFRACKQLDRKHAVFGRLVGGMETLNAIERVETDKSDRPKEDIRIVNTQVFQDPYEEADTMLANEREEAKNVEARKEQERVVQERRERGQVLNGKEDIAQPKALKQGVGKYIGKLKEARDDRDKDSAMPAKKKKTETKGFGDFSGW